MTVRIIQGDCREVLATLPAASVQCCVTSPPYFGLRDYGHTGQIGLEQTPAEYVEQMVQVFREVRRVLADDGTLWLNIGDSYARDPGKGGSGPGGKNIAYGDSYTDAARVRSEAKGSSDGKVGRGDRAPVRVGGAGIKQKDLIGIPWMVAFALRADGWYLRQDIIWHKPNPMPESVRDRCTKAHEYLFLLSKSDRYYCDMKAIAEPAISEQPSGNGFAGRQGGAGHLPMSGGNGTAERWIPASMRNSFARATKYTEGAHGTTPQHRPDREPVHYAGTRNRRSVWTVATKPYKGAHFATFPPDLIEPCILAGAPRGGLVLDPFTGSGTTAAVATLHGRHFVGCELNAAYIELARQRIASVSTAKPKKAQKRRQSAQRDLFGAAA